MFYYLLIYALGSFIAFMTVLKDFYKNYCEEVPIQQIEKDYPEACVVFCSAAFLSWIYIASYCIYHTYLYIKEKL